MFFWLQTISTSCVTFVSHEYAKFVWDMLLFASPEQFYNLIVFAIFFPLFGISQLAKMIQQNKLR